MRISVILLVALGIIVGCGESEEKSAPSSSPASKAPSKAEFIRRADAICAERSRQVVPLEKAYKAEIERENYDAAANQIREILPIARGTAEKIRALTPPEGDEAPIGSYTDTIIENVGTVRRYASALEDEDAARVKSIGDELKQGRTRIQALAQGYGFKKCGSD